MVGAPILPSLCFVSALAPAVDALLARVRHGKWEEEDRLRKFANALNALRSLTCQTPSLSLSIRKRAYPWLEEWRFEESQFAPTGDTVLGGTAVPASLARVD